MSAGKRQRIDIRLSDADKNMIDEAAMLTNQTVTQFIVSCASARAAEVIEQQRRIALSRESWERVMDAINNPAEPNERLKQAAKRLHNME